MTLVYLRQEDDASATLYQEVARLQNSGSIV